MALAASLGRDAFCVFYPITTRWADNDIYGHINNVVYYSFFDTVVNRFLIEQAGLNIQEDETVAFVVQSHCDYVSPLAYPDSIEIGLGVEKLGTSSVTYCLGVFKKDANAASAHGGFVHVFVDRNTNKSVSIPDHLRRALELISLKV